MSKATERLQMIFAQTRPHLDVMAVEIDRIGFDHMCNIVCVFGRYSYQHSFEMNRDTEFDVLRYLGQIEALHSARMNISDRIEHLKRCGLAYADGLLREALNTIPMRGWSISAIAQ